VSVFLATYFETSGHFDSNVKLLPVIYANYRPMTDDRRQTETLLDKNTDLLGSFHALMKFKDIDKIKFAISEML
jgi:hypothetical protein